VREKTHDFLNKVRDAFVHFTGKLSQQDDFYQDPVWDDLFLENQVKPPISSHTR
jgi:hypothetical protein